MNDYLKHKELYHSGVKGMKWGVIKKPEELEDRRVYDMILWDVNQKKYLELPTEYRKRVDKVILGDLDKFTDEDKKVYETLDIYDKETYRQSSPEFRKKFNAGSNTDTPEEWEKESEKNTKSIKYTEKDVQDELEKIWEKEQPYRDIIDELDKRQEKKERTKDVIKAVAGMTFGAALLLYLEVSK